jgi:asparagine synthase (glutamine-hydrolysing)
MGRLWPMADWLPRLLRAKTTLTNLALEPAAAYANTLCLCRQRVRRRLLSPDMCAELNGHRPEEFITRNYAGGSGDALRGMISADMATLLPDDFLTKVDRASMACGLEVRPPLVDHEFLELAFSVPSNWKIRGGETKWLLKRMYRDRLPSQIVSRGKQGFDVPIDAWLRGPLKETLEQTVLAPDSPLSEIIDQRYAQRLNRAHQTRTGRHGGLLWSLLVLDRWMNTYLRPPPTLST